MNKIIYIINFVVLVGFAYPAYCHDYTNIQGLNLNIPKTESKPVLIIDKSESSTTTRLYIDEIEKEIQTNIAGRKPPTDNFMKRNYGVFTVRITLQKDGRVNEVQVLPSPESVTSGNYLAFSESVASTIKGEKPFPQFPPDSFTGYELITYETSIEIANSTDASRSGNKKGRHGAH